MPANPKHTFRKNDKKPEVANRFYNVRNSLVNYYLLLMFTFFPIFLSNQYSHARRDKYMVFLILSAVLAIGVSFVSLTYFGEKKRLGIPVERPRLTAPDIAMLAFFGCAAISTVFSAYPKEALLGTTGRNNGLLLLFFYLLVYFILSRWHRFKSYVIASYLAVSSFVAGLAVLNAFYIDPFGLLYGYPEDIVANFASTIGNQNIVSSFICLFLPTAVMLFVVCQEKFLRVLAGISIFFAFTGLLASNSSSGFLGLMAAVFVMAVFSARRYEWLKRYALAMAILFASGKLLMLISLLLPEAKAFENIPLFFIESPWMFLPVAVFALLFLLMALGEKKLAPVYTGRMIRTSVIAVGVLVFAGLALAFFYFSVIDTVTDLGEMEKLLRLNDRWGTHRGFMWINGMKDFSQFTVFKKLLGSGPDTFYFVFEPHFNELFERFGDTDTDCIHNEYLNYLITQGILGLLSYLALLISVIARGVKNIRRHPLSAVFLSAIVCYMAQALVNLYQPITTPIFIIFLSLTESFSRLTDEETAWIKF